MSVSDIFVEFDGLHRAALAEQTKTVADQSERRQLVVALMKNVVKPFADEVIDYARKRNIAISVDDRGNDERRPSYTIQFDSYENSRAIDGPAPSIKLTATADCKRVEVAEEMGSVEDSLNSPLLGSYHVDMGRPDTLNSISAALEKWLRHTLSLLVARK